MDVSLSVGLISLSATRADIEYPEVVMARKLTQAVALIAAGGVTAGAALAAAPSAHALPALETQKTGSCTAGAWWDLSLEREYGSLEVDFDIERARAGERWTVTLTHNGATKKAVRVVTDYEGDADAQWILRDRAGTDRIVVKATSASGQTCKASGRI
jgi:hypothetical protein